MGNYVNYISFLFQKILDVNYYRVGYHLQHDVTQFQV